MFVRATGASLIAMGLLTSMAQAHRASMNRDVCFLGVGPDVMQFTAYQPQNEGTKFCKDIPEVGPAIIVLDYVDPELRDMTTDIRIVKDVDGGGASGLATMLSDAVVAPGALDPVTEEHLPPKLYPSGTINFQHNFANPGKYHAIVTVRNEHGQTYVSEFPLSVGRARERTLLAYGLAMMGVVAGVFLYCLHARRSRTAAPAKMA